MFHTGLFRQTVNGDTHHFNAQNREDYNLMLSLYNQGLKDQDEAYAMYDESMHELGTIADFNLSNWIMETKNRDLWHAKYDDLYNRQMSRQQMAPMAGLLGALQSRLSAFGGGLNTGDTPSSGNQYANPYTKNYQNMMQMLPMMRK